jgi:hypothetical protein
MVVEEALRLLVRHTVIEQATKTKAISCTASSFVRRFLKVPQS